MHLNTQHNATSNNPLPFPLTRPPILTLTQFTRSTQAPVAPLGALPLRLMLTTERPVRRASSLMRLPRKPLPPKMTSFGGPEPGPPPPCG